MADGDDDKEHCARCCAPAPPQSDGAFLDWEALGPEGNIIICPECISAEEQQAMDEADMAIGQEVAGLAGHWARCLRFVPYVDDDPSLPSGWKVLDHDEVVLFVLCPDCIQPDDEFVE